MKKGLLAAGITGIWLVITGCCSGSEEESGALDVPSYPIQSETELDAASDDSAAESVYPEKLGTLIPEQTFEITLDDWGKVTFASFAPENNSFQADGMNPDVRFCLADAGEVIYEFPGWNEEHVNADLFLAVSAVAFKDYNEDGLLDVITLCEYETMSGEGFQTARIYYQMEDKQGFEEDFSDRRYHHEIYLGDPRRAAPGKLKTVLRHPIRKA